MEDILKLSIRHFQTKPLENPGLLLKGVSEKIQNEAKEPKEGFLSILFGTLGASLLGNTLTGKRTNRTGERHESSMKTRIFNTASFFD